MPADNFDKVVGDMIRQERKARGLRLRDLAQKVGISDTYLGYMERGLKPWKLRYIRAIAEEFGCYLHVVFIEGREHE